jgi:hypothetical protein
MIIAFTLNTVLIYLSAVYHVPGNVSVNILQIYFMLITFLGLIFLPYHRQHYGFNLRNLRYNVITGSILGLTGLLLSSSFRYSMYTSGHKEFGFYFDPLAELVRFSTYLLFTFSQEAVSKGFFQSYFHAIFDGKRYQQILTVFLAALVFSQFHLIYDFGLVFVTFIYALVSGFYYEKTRSLVGVFIFHFLSGAGIFFFSTLY